MSRRLRNADTLFLSTQDYSAPFLCDPGCMTTTSHTQHILVSTQIGYFCRTLRRQHIESRYSIDNSNRRNSRNLCVKMLWSKLRRQSWRINRQDSTVAKHGNNLGPVLVGKLHNSRRPSDYGAILWLRHRGACICGRPDRITAGQSECQ